MCSICNITLKNLPVKGRFREFCVFIVRKHIACDMLAPSAVALATSTIRASAHPRGAFYLIGRNFLLDKNSCPRCDSCFMFHSSILYLSKRSQRISFDYRLIMLFHIAFTLIVVQRQPCIFGQYVAGTCIKRRTASFPGDIQIILFCLRIFIQTVLSVKLSLHSAGRFDCSVKA